MAYPRATNPAATLSFVGYSCGMEHNSIGFNLCSLLYNMLRNNNKVLNINKMRIMTIIRISVVRFKVTKRQTLEIRLEKDLGYVHDNNSMIHHQLIL